MEAALREIADRLDRIASLIEPVARRASSERSHPIDLSTAGAFVWSAADAGLDPVARVNRVDLDLLKGIDLSRDLLLENTRRFATGLPANNALLWGARGMGKSSLVKAVHGTLSGSHDGLKLVEIHREDIDSLPVLLNRLRQRPERVILFCDDLSFDHDDTSYKALKAALDGGIEGRPDNVILYATSNRRHLMPRDMIDNERSTAINPSEAIEEKVSLSDRFGLWLGFHKCDQDAYLAMVEGYLDRFGLGALDDATRADALEWSTTRGSRSGRVAWQYITDLAGRRGRPLSVSDSPED